LDDVSVAADHFYRQFGLRQTTSPVARIVHQPMAKGVRPLRL
jgi:hypothetical protein